MRGDLTGLHVGDYIYTHLNFGCGIRLARIVGETVTAWRLEHKYLVRKKDGYLIGSDAGGRFGGSTYYAAATPEIIAEHRRQVLSRKIELLGTAKVAVTTESYDELRAAVDTIYRHVTPDPKKS
jgi:hypothetical protein